MVPVVVAQGIDGNDIAACSDHRTFTKLFPTSKAREARECFDAIQRNLVSAAQTRVSSNGILPVYDQIVWHVVATLWTVLHVIGGL